LIVTKPYPATQHGTKRELRTSTRGQSVDSVPVAFTDPIRIVPHEVVPGTGSFEVRFADGRTSRYFYYDDDPSRRIRPGTLTKAQAREQAKAFAREARDGKD
jgi:hypothetical protein